MQRWASFLLWMVLAAPLWGQPPADLPQIVTQKTGSSWWKSWLSPAGDTLLPGRYQYASFYRDSNYLSTIDPEGASKAASVWHHTGRLIFRVENGHIQSGQKRVQSFVVYDREGGAWALIDTAGEKLLPFRDWNLRSQGEVVLAVDNWYPNHRDKTTIYKANGKQLLPGRYERCDGGLRYVIVKQKGRFGMYDLEGQEIFPMEYLDINARNGIVRLRVPNPSDTNQWHYELYEDRGFTRIAGNLETMNPENPYGLIKVKRNGKWGLVDRTGKELLPCEYGYMGPFDQRGRAVVARSFDRAYKVADRAELIDTTGKKLFPHPYNSLREHTSYYVVGWGRKYGILDRQTLDTAFAFDYSRVHLTHYGHYIILRTHKEHATPNVYGLIDRKGDTLLPFDYRYIGELKKNTVIVMEKKRVGAIDIYTREPISDNTFNGAFPSWRWFTNKGFIAVRKGRRYGLVDKQWKVVVPPKYMDEMQIKGNVIIVHTKGQRRYGAYNTSGKLIVPVEYDNCSAQPDGTVKARKGWWFYFFDQEGNLLRKERMERVQPK